MEKIMSDHEMKRILGVGMGTRSELLREYKDPFEPREVVPMRRRITDGGGRPQIYFKERRLSNRVGVGR